MKRVFLVSVFALFALTLSGATQPPVADPPISERMFYALLNPDSTPSLEIECPTTLIDADEWWQTCGKFFVLNSEKRSPGPNALKLAWSKAKDDVAHLKLDPDMTYAKWSGGSAADRNSIRTRLLVRVRSIVRDNQVFETLESLSAPTEAVNATLDRLQRHIRGTLGDNELFHYCPGATGNIAINPQHQLFGKLTELEQDPTFAALLTDVGKEYHERLKANSDMDAEARQRVLENLLAEKEVMSKLK